MAARAKIQKLQQAEAGQISPSLIAAWTRVFDLCALADERRAAKAKQRLPEDDCQAVVGGDEVFVNN